MNSRKRGFTLIELLVVIAIIGILSSVVLSALNTSRAKGRYALVIQQMEEIKKAAELTFQNGYAPDASRNVFPYRLAPALSVWPTPPCPGWTYDWDNVGDYLILVKLQRPNNGAPVMYYCIYDANNLCVANSGSYGANIQTNWPSKTFTCDE